MAKDPNLVASKWAKGFAGSKENYKAGVDQVTQSPGERAIANTDAWLQGVVEANESGKWAAGNRSYTLTEWKDLAGKSVNKFDAAAKNAEPKMQKFLSKWLPFVESVQKAVKGMPNSTPEEREQRMLENTRKLREFKYKKGS